MAIVLDRPELLPMDPTIIIFLVLMLGMMWFVSQRTKKQQAAIRQRQEEALVPGTWVQTIGGFLGKIVDIDGDVITLESPSGVETIWIKQAIKEPKEPPYADVEDADDDVELGSTGTVGTTGPVISQDPIDGVGRSDDGRDTPTARP